jgi:hypothetical protein
MPALNIAVLMIGVAVAGLGLVGLLAPSQLLDFGRSLLTETGLYIVAAARVGFGVLLLFAARLSRMPRTLRVFGILIIVAGLTTPLFGVERSVSMFNWLSAQAPALVRVMATLAIAFGTLVVYATIPRGRSTD